MAFFRSDSTENSSATITALETKTVLLRDIIQINLSDQASPDRKFVPGDTFVSEIRNSLLERLDKDMTELKAAAPEVHHMIRPNRSAYFKSKGSEMTDDSIFYYCAGTNFYPLHSYDGENLSFSRVSPAFTAMTAPFRSGDMDNRLEPHPHIDTIVAAVNTFASSSARCSQSNVYNYGGDGDGFAYFDSDLQQNGGSIKPGSYRYNPLIINKKEIAVHVFGVKDGHPLDLTEDSTHKLKKVIWAIANQNDKNNVAVHCKAGIGRTGHMIFMFRLIQRLMLLSEEEIRRDRLLEGGFARFLIDVVNDIRGINATIKIPGTTGSANRTVNVIATNPYLISNNEQYVFAVINAFAVYLYACKNGLHKKPVPILCEYMEKSLDDWVKNPLHPRIRADVAISNDRLQKMCENLHNVVAAAPAMKISRR